jgi:hypothetical protein
MQSAETVLDVIRKRGARGLPIERLYRQLFNPKLYLMAYRRIAANKGAMTPGVTGETVDGMSLDKIDACAGSLRHERHRWSPAKPASETSLGSGGPFGAVRPMASAPQQHRQRFVDPGWPRP